jgi:hypothetical protein
LRALPALLAVAVIATSVSAQRPAPVSHLGIGARDYTNNITATWRGLFPNPLPAVESTMSNPRVVYVRGQSPAITITLENSASVALPVQVTFSNFGLTLGSLPTHSLSVSPATTTLTVPAFQNGVTGKATTNITLSTLPGFVCIGNLFGTVKATLTQDVYNPNGSLFALAGTQVMNAGFPADKVYCTNQTPTGHQALVWTDLLDFSCSWAFGSSGASNVADKLAQGLFSSGKLYDSNVSPQYNVPRFDQAGYDFELSGAIESFGVPGSTFDCQDGNGFLFLAAQSQGLGVQTRSITSAGGQNHNPFWINPICPMGKNPYVETNYVEDGGFYFHYIIQMSGQVYDGVIAQRTDPAGNSYRRAPAGWNLSSYWQSASPVGSTGLAYAPVIPGFPRPSQPAPVQMQNVSFPNTPNIITID